MEDNREAKTKNTPRRGRRSKNPDKLGLGTMFLWCGNGASLAVHAVLIGYVTSYCTNALGMSAAVVGTLLMVNKIFDGITDLFAGFIVDRTNTKIGRGRPYDLCIIGLWITTWLLFSVPASMTETMKCAWIFICYTLCQSVFKTFLSAAGTLHGARLQQRPEIREAEFLGWTPHHLRRHRVQRHLPDVLRGALSGSSTSTLRTRPAFRSGCRERQKERSGCTPSWMRKISSRTRWQRLLNSTDGSGTSVFSGTVQDLTGCKPLYFVFHGTGSLRFEAFTIQCVS